MNKENFYIGIDLGTTNSVISFGKKDQRKNRFEAKVFKIKSLNKDGNIEGNNLLPSYVYFKENDNPIIGSFAKSRINTQYSRVVKSIKSKMGENISLNFDNNNYTPEKISSLILTFLGKKVEEIIKEYPTDVIITVPASFNSDQREATIKAAEMAGFKIYNEDGSKRNILLDEPRAALFDFIESYNRNEIPNITIDLNVPKNILVYDLGGGTLDVSLHQVNYDYESDKINIQDFAVSRYTQIGGDNFDEILANYFKNKLEKKGLKYNSLSQFDKTFLDMKLLEIAEESKISFSTEIFNALDFGSEEDLCDLETDLLYPNIWDNRGIEDTLTLKSYENIVQELLGKHLIYEDFKRIDSIEFEKNNNIIFPILDVLSKAHKKINKDIKIDAILLNGGMTKFYPIKKRIEDFFGFKALPICDEDQSVAKGAVYYHNSLHRGIKYNKIQNESIGIETEGGFVKHLIPAGTVLPFNFEIKNKFEVRENGATSLILPFYLGERNDTTSPNRKIASRRICFDKPLSEGTPINLEISIDEAGIMNLKGWLDNNKTNSFEVNIETDNIEIEERKILKTTKQYQKIKKIENIVKKYGPNIDIDEFIFKFDKLFKDKNFNQDEYKNMVNKIKNSENGYLLGNYFLEKIDKVTKENKSKIILILGEIGKCDETLKYNIIEQLLKITSEDNILTLEPKDINRIIKDCINAFGKLQVNYTESHLLYLLNLPYTINIQEDLIVAIGKVSYSKNALKHLEKYLEVTTSEDIGKRTRLIWAIAKIGSREKENSIEIQAILKSIDLIKNILSVEKHKELVQNCIYALGELCDSRFGNEISEDLSQEIILFLNEIAKTKGAKLQKFISLIINMIKGNILTQEEEENLLSIRTKIS